MANLQTGQDHAGAGAK